MNINFEKFLHSHYFQLVLTFAMLAVFILIRQFFRSMVRARAIENEMGLSQRKYAHKFFNIIFTLLFLIGLGVIWDISVKGLSVYFASIFTIIGVALFANWSILSNVTSSIILFFTSPFKIGSKIEILDKDDSIAGTVVDITFFTIKILTEDGFEIAYPNNLALQKPIKLLNKNGLESDNLQ